MTGYDRYLEKQFGWTGSFYTTLFDAISLADRKNTSKLAEGFPEEVDAYRIFTQEGRDAFLAKCDPGHPLVKKIAEGKAYL